MTKLQKLRKLLEYRIPLKWNIIGIFIVILAYLMFNWPQLTLDRANRFGFEPDEFAKIGQMGDVYGSLNATFTLLALLVSVYINFIQFKQFASIERRESMQQVRRFNDRMNDDHEIIPTILEIESDKIIFIRKSDSYGFENKFNKSDADANRRAHKVLAFFEEYIACLQGDLVDQSLTFAVSQRMYRFLTCDQMKKFINSFDNDNKIAYPNIRRVGKKHNSAP